MIGCLIGSVIVSSIVRAPPEAAATAALKLKLRTVASRAADAVSLRASDTLPGAQVYRAYTKTATAQLRRWLR